ncbi:MAG: GyrI-like domain-containing protein [Actinomycetales bacterium]
MIESGPDAGTDVAVEQFDGLRVVVLERTIEREHIVGFLGEAFMATAAAVAEAGSHPTGPAVARYDMADDRFMVQAGFPVDRAFTLTPFDGLKVDEFISGPVATLMVQGPYEQIPQAYQRISGWMAEHGYRPDGRP